MKNRKINIENLYELYADEIYNKANEQTKELQIKKANKLDELNSNLNSEQITLLKEILEIETQRKEIVDKEMFTFAFSLGLKLVYEGLDKEDNE